MPDFSPESIVRASFMKNIVYFFVFFSLALFLGAGCGQRPTPSGFPGKFHSCEISIIQDGKPLRGAVVSLVPVDGSKSWGTSATTDQSGKAEMLTYLKWKGSPEGDFKVIVTKMISEEDPKKPEGDGLFYYTVAEQYGNARTTPFAIKVDKPTKETFDVGASVKTLIRP